MARTRSTTAPRLNRDATRLVSLAQALNRSGSRLEDLYWEAQLAEAIGKLLRPSSDGPLEAALDHLAQQDIGAYEVLIEQAETLSESMKADKNGVRHDVLLLVAPVVAWTRYAIPTGPIPAAAQQALLAQLHGHVLASDARVALLPHLVSIDQMPRSFAETAQWMQRLAGQALGGAPTRTIIDAEAETANMLADTRYLVAAVAVPEHAPIFRWQERPEDAEASRDACLARWSEQAMPTLATLLPGCGLECLLPDAYYVSNREADRRVRPLSLRAAVSWLEGATNLSADQLRAVIAACGQEHIEEYRIGFTPRNSNDVYYGCVWPVYGREEEQADDEAPDVADQIAALLKEYGVSEIRRIPGRLQAEFCDDCGAPYFPDPLGVLVHAELPEDAEAVPAKFH
ncbi:DUF2863 family protein [Bordetella pseudohinzii]|uniref:DUF2863 domain-containing protein n=1 Tax=Bordetella pseudohinzii TaxID=1331258 RepID=A0ABN4RMP1_9BORD|nr:DUF2863 family protein [Bordetella pseudohinzii]ANY15273.1 hypothetical protein BBN53_04820 [Bordetella pseudohinzii]KMM24348.1 hypothetical protein L540_07075 [Bordetella pseudohinzii]KXA75643.1 hypothetical protein AW877_19360 [Bordetella pseudohinzii]KXA76056.1 hypothetical protein AW878_18945 [Bordetella pseudohinzii]